MTGIPEIDRARFEREKQATPEEIEELTRGFEEFLMAGRTLNVPVAGYGLDAMRSLIGATGPIEGYPGLWRVTGVEDRGSFSVFVCTRLDH